MNLVLWLLTSQCLMGAFDNLWHHEITERLPAKRSARRELTLHSAREFLYAIVFLGLAWREWHGAWAWTLVAILLLEVTITLADFVEEDRTRSLPRLERILHTVLALNFGVWLGVFAPYLLHWAQQTTSLVRVDYGWFSTAFTAASIGVFAWSLRNLHAVLKHVRPPAWLRQPIYIGAQSGRTILITGATGFIGSALLRHLLARGDNAIVLTRDADKALNLFGPHVHIVQSLDAIDSATRIDGIVNLAGAPIMALPWTAGRRRVLLESRLRTTKAIVQLCGRLQALPRVLVSGSAIGYYGVRGDDECDEFASPSLSNQLHSQQFQSELCKQWEQAALAAQSLGVRVVLLRTGLVLGSQGGVLPMMTLPIRLFLGSLLGPGSQWMSWIHLHDVVRLIDFALDRPMLSGPLNATAPHAVRHADFQRRLAGQLHRKVWLRIPAPLLRASLGEMAQLLVDGQRVIPRKSQVHGFRFKYPTLKAALAALYPRRALRLTNATSNVYFNGACPICAAEINHYAGIAKRAAASLCFIDSQGTPEAFAHYGLRAEHLEQRLYVRDTHGRIASGVDAILQIWRQLPGYRWAAKALALPGIRQLATAAYDLAIAPALTSWARRRQTRHAAISLR